MGLFDKFESLIKNEGDGASNANTHTLKPNNDVTSDYFPSELEKLISIVIADGRISEQGRQVLYKKAASLGVDTDELDIVLEARIAHINSKNTVNNSASTKHGELKKCPACGTPITSLSIKCPDCGFEFQGLQANNTIQILFEKLNEVEGNRKSGKSTIGGLFTQILDEIINDEDTIIQRKKQIIKTFPIPTTKSDLLEFLSVAVPLAKEKKSGIFTIADDNFDEYNLLAPAWKAKCEEVVIKAKIVMRDDPSMLREILDIAKSIGIK